MNHLKNLKRSIFNHTTIVCMYGGLRYLDK